LKVGEDATLAALSREESADVVRIAGGGHSGSRCSIILVSHVKHSAAESDRWHPM
jgi:hypothetical protein